MDKIPVLDLKPQYDQIKEEIKAAIDEVLESGSFIMGPAVKEFEREVATYLGVKHAIAVNSGTDALVIGLRSLGIGPGDEVITTPFSFFATAESIGNVGATPVFADICADTYNLDPTALAAKITPRTKAILPVHLYGRPAAMAEILEIAQAYDLQVVEDCAQSFGARYWSECLGQEAHSSHPAIEGKFTGTIGHIGAFSFFPSKNLGAYGDGGLIVTDDEEAAELARMLRVHGARKKYYNERLGYNSRLDSLQAAILRVKLKYIDTWNENRQGVARAYNDLLGGIDRVIVPEITKGHVFHQYTVRITDHYRDGIAQELDAKGIQTMIYYPVPQDRLPLYQDRYPANPVSDLLSTQVLSLPIWPEMTSEAIERVASEIQRCLMVP
jgi:dTDP-4-amino-4,6-dideoxygalactose transaminase